MGISFQKAIDLMKKQKITSYTMRKSKLLGQGTMYKLHHNECVTTDTIEVLCKLLNCQPGDLMEYIPDEES